MFASVDEEYVDNSALTTEIEDVPMSELLVELRAIAAALRRPVAAADDLA